MIDAVGFYVVREEHELEAVACHVVLAERFYYFFDDGG